MESWGYAGLYMDDYVYWKEEWWMGNECSITLANNYSLPMFSILPIEEKRDKSWCYKSEIPNEIIAVGGDKLIKWRNLEPVDGPLTVQSP